MKKATSLLVLLIIFVSCNSKKETSAVEINNGNLYLIVGSYSDGTTPGISVYNFGTQTGDFEYVSEIKDIVNPSYLVVSPDEKFVYSVNETSNGAVGSFAFDKPTGTLSLLNYRFTEGADPCYINLNKEQTALVTANYSGGNISVFPLNEQGYISPIAQNITFSPQSHIHTVVFSPDETHLLATDLGKDKIYTFKVSNNENGIYLEQKPNHTVILKSGSGPRHLAFHPRKNVVYCINELSGMVTTFDYREGILTAVQYLASDTTSGVGGKGSADIHLTPDGRFLYTSNRLKADGIAIFSVNPENGQLTNIGYQETGIHPRNFIISPNGKFLLCANRDSNTVQIFEINPQTGLLQNTGKEIPVNKPVCLKWIKKG
jgi:6-phosphogluconolactonase (cycloisomerase 2 family)